MRVSLDRLPLSALLCFGVLMNSFWSVAWGSDSAAPQKKEVVAPEKIAAENAFESFFEARAEEAILAEKPEERWNEFFTPEEQKTFESELEKRLEADNFSKYKHKRLYIGDSQKANRTAWEQEKRLGLTLIAEQAPLLKKPFGPEEQSRFEVALMRRFVEKELLEHPIHSDNPEEERRGNVANMVMRESLLKRSFFDESIAQYVEKTLKDPQFDTPENRQALMGDMIGQCIQDAKNGLALKGTKQ